MSRNKKYRNKRKRINPVVRIFNGIVKSIKNIPSYWQTKPVEYRPYLGENSKTETESSEKEIKPRPKLKPPKPPRKKIVVPGLDLNEIKKNRATRKADKKKKKYKHKIKKKHKQEYRKRARIDFIRKFYPYYKKERNIPLTELSKDEAEEVIKAQQKNFFYYTINSVALYIVAYLLVFMLYQLTILVTASRWKLDSVLFYYDLAFNDYSPLWSRSNIIVITFAGPLISLIVGFIFYRLIATRPKIKGFAKLFSMWIAIHAFNLFFGAFASGVSFDQGFGYVPAWLYWSVFWQILASLVFLFILGLIGYYSASKFLDTSNSAYRVRPENKTKFLLFQVILPWIIGAIALLLVKIPNNMPYETATLFTMGFAVVPVLFNRMARPTVGFKRERKPTQIKWIFVVLCILVLLAFRIGLNNGLHIVLNYKLIFSLDVTPL